MRVMVLGSGGREHALARGLSLSPHVREIVCVPGNAGTAQFAENIEFSPIDHAAIIKLAREKKIDLTVVGPEAPLCAGIVDRFRAAGLRIFGPTAAAARIEGDKAYAKQLMKHAHVPTAEGRVFEHFKSAQSYVASRDTGVVVKAAGLAGGKGVFVCPDPAQGLLALEKIMLDRVFGEAGDCVVVEELLKGPELSVFALISGQSIYMLECAQDHKALCDGDTGPNTGGMGAYSPASVASSDARAVVERDIIVPIVDALRNDQSEYSGILYAGLMLTPAGPKVLEFNCRFGDPEAQVLLTRLDSDLFELLDAAVEGKLDQIEIRWKPQAAVCVVMASQGYPDEYKIGKSILGLDDANSLHGVHVYHASTRRIGDTIVSSGGRVLGVTALGADLAEARERAYEAVEKIRFENAYYRKDIALRATARVSPV